jgi:hypothetical protein
MIEVLKSIVLEIRREREAELKQYKAYCRDSASYEERKAVLLLELPFKTDKASIHFARASAYQEQENERNKSLRIDDEQIVQEEKVLVIRDSKPLQKEGKISVINKKRIKASSISAYTLMEKWIGSANAYDTKNVRRVVTGILQRWITNFYALHPTYDKIWRLAPSSLSGEDLVHILTMEVMEKIIEGIDVSDSTKEVYLSHARNLREFIIRTYPISPTLKGRRSQLSLSDAAKLFEYLETRALKSTKVEKCEDILLCRGLFYAPLLEQDFFDLGPPDEESACLRSGESVFYVPSSFIKLWKAFSKPDRLFSRKFDHRQLHKKIQRLGQYSKLEIESLTPSILRSSAKAICFTHLLLDDSVITHLPKRN